MTSEAKRLAEAYGFKFLRRAKGSHEIWVHPDTGRLLLVASSKKGLHGWKAFKADLKRRSRK